MADDSAATRPEPEGTEPEVDETTEAAEAEPAFMNRAARRAHAQGTKPQRSSGASGQFGRRGTVQGPRQYGTRRSG